MSSESLDSLWYCQDEGGGNVEPGEWKRSSVGVSLVWWRVVYKNGLVLGWGENHTFSSVNFPSRDQTQLAWYIKWAEWSAFQTAVQTKSLYTLFFLYCVCFQKNKNVRMLSRINSFVIISIITLYVAFRGPSFQHWTRSKSELSMSSTQPFLVVVRGLKKRTA